MKVYIGWRVRAAYDGRWALTKEGATWWFSPGKGQLFVARDEAIKALASHPWGSPGKLVRVFVRRP